LSYSSTSSSASRSPVTSGPPVRASGAVSLLTEHIGRWPPARSRTVGRVTTWQEFSEVAPKIAAIFSRRHAATGNLCFLATLRSDGSPRISPMEPRMFEGQLWLGGMPGTTKFRDLARDPRFCLHTATVDTHVSDGDAKLWGTVHDVQDLDLHARYAENLFQGTGFDLTGMRIATGIALAGTILAALTLLLSDHRL
jgi:hypothetical protein